MSIPQEPHPEADPRVTSQNPCTPCEPHLPPSVPMSLTSMAASVWMYSMSVAARPSSRLPRCAELTMPEVMVFCRAKGLPMATTNSPCLTSAERPSGSVGSGCCGERDSQQDKAGQRGMSPLPRVPTAVTHTYLGLDLDGGNVCHLVHILHHGVVHLAAGQPHPHAPPVRHHVSVGDNQPIRGHHKARAIGDGHLPAQEGMPARRAQVRRGGRDRAGRRQRAVAS